MKGVTPANTWPNVTGMGDELRTTNTLSPTGGVSTPISASLTDTTPSQMGSNPDSFITGNMMGSVITMIAMGSMKQPRMRNSTMKPSRYMYLVPPSERMVLEMVVTNPE